MSVGHNGNLVTLRELLPAAQRGGYAVGSFAPRYLAMIRYVLRAGQELESPLIVQISGNEMRWFATTAREFADEFWNALWQERVTVPVALHLDHTKERGTIEEAIAAGFTSVMIDRSELPLEENILITRAIVDLARRDGVSVEGELGRIGSADRLETGEDVESMTDPGEAARFAAATGIDALAVSVGTAHGIHTARPPYIDLARLSAIRAATDVPLVLHGGSGVSSDLIARAIALPGGGVSKINIATDLERAMLAALGRDSRASNAELATLPTRDRERAGEAVAAAVRDKITNFLRSEATA